MCLPGDRDVHEIKLAKLLGAQHVTMADEATVREVTGAEVGYAGPIGIGVKVVADERLRGIRGATAGPNETDKHFTHVDLERDAEVALWGDLSLVRAGDACPRCREPMVEKRGIEVGHVFKLGTKYSEALGARYLDADGAQHSMVMGCYGIGVSRTLQAAIEQCHDEHGIVWPISIAPFEVLVTALDPDDDELRPVLDQLVAALEAEGAEVLVDDRDERPGVKFKDADLVGVPVRVTLGKRGLSKGVIEVKLRGEADREDVPVADAASAVLAKVRALREACA